MNHKCIHMKLEIAPVLNKIQESCSRISRNAHNIHMIALTKSKSLHIECGIWSRNGQRRNSSRCPEPMHGIRSFIDLIIRNLMHLSEGSGRQQNLRFYENLHNSKQLDKHYTELLPLSF